MDTAADQLSTEVVDNFEECFANINDTVEHLHFTFAEDAKLLLRETIDDFVAEVNTAIQQGQVPPKSKMPELIPRVATALHVFNYTSSLRWVNYRDFLDSRQSTEAESG